MNMKHYIMPLVAFSNALCSSSKYSFSPYLTPMTKFKLSRPYRNAALVKGTGVALRPWQTNCRLANLKCLFHESLVTFRYIFDRIYMTPFPVVVTLRLCDGTRHKGCLTDKLQRIIEFF